MLFIALAKFKKKLSREVVAENLKDIEDDTKGQVRMLGISWTLGRYDTVVLFEAPNEKGALHMALKRADRMDVETRGRARGCRESGWTGLTGLVIHSAPTDMDSGERREEDRWQFQSKLS